MEKDQLSHLLRAIYSETGKRLIVIGSQSVLAKVKEDNSGVLKRSMEADVLAMDAMYDQEFMDAVDGSWGELSHFHDTFGVFAQGVSGSTAVMPKNWKNRLCNLMSDESGKGVAFAVEIHDLACSKLKAARDKDWPFLSEMAKQGLIDQETLKKRIMEMPVQRSEMAAMTMHCDRIFDEANRLNLTAKPK